ALYDDELDITGWLSWVEGSRFQVDYDIYRNEELLVSGYTIHVVINDERRPRRVPAEMTALL
ncbi:MAG: Tol-Pal system-associated acyl-CoA thioesterase, partial [Spirochaetia bacterium]|nr:Tol-Pal system-associated acyl-CoA thioesterase [Spirochaetia bacterium]